MRPEERDAAFLWDMEQAARGALDTLGERALQEFLGPESHAIRRAVERELEILGEAARRVSEPFRQAHPEIPWRDIIGLRNIISHQYDRVNYAELYRIVRGRLPGLIRGLERLVPPLPGRGEP